MVQPNSHSWRDYQPSHLRRLYLKPQQKIAFPQVTLPPTTRRATSRGASVMHLMQAPRERRKDGEPLLTRTSSQPVKVLRQ